MMKRKDRSITSNKWPTYKFISTPSYDNSWAFKYSYFTVVAINRLLELGYLPPDSILENTQGEQFIIRGDIDAYMDPSRTVWPPQRLEAI